MTLNEILKKFEEDVVMEDPGTVSLDSELDDLEGWDSVAKISLLALFDKEFGVAISEQQLKGFSKVSDILDLVKDKLQ